MKIRSYWIMGALAIAVWYMWPKKSGPTGMHVPDDAFELDPDDVAAFGRK